MTVTGHASGGYPLLARFTDGPRIEQRFAQQVKRSRDWYELTVPEFPRDFIDTHALGAERFHDVDEMRHDPLLTRA